MNKPPAFFWYPKECDTDENVRLMDDAEFGFYMRCLNHAWLNDGLPESLEDIARLMVRPVSRVRAYWKRVGKCFVKTDGRWRNPKQEHQRKSAGEYQASRRAAANKRWHPNDLPDNVKNTTTCKDDARALHVQCSASASAFASAKDPQTPARNLHVVPEPAGESELSARPIVEAVRHRDEEFRRVFEKCWTAHKKYDKQQNRMLTESTLYERFISGKLDIAEMEARHGPYADSREIAGWDYSTLSLLAWVDFGMPEGVKEPKRMKLTHDEKRFERLVNREV